MNTYDELFETALHQLSEELGREINENDVDVKHIDINNEIITLFEKKVRKYFKFIPQAGDKWKIIQL